LTSLLSVVGLALDLIGAGALALGLFRGVIRTTWNGYNRSPETAAEDQAYGVVGFLFLAAGFALQALSAFGLGKVDHACTGIVGGVAALVVGTGSAYVLFGFVYILRFPRLRTQARSEKEDPLRPVHRERRGRRFWTFVED
jgi:hypothetical protein